MKTIEYRHAFKVIRRMGGGGNKIEKYEGMEKKEERKGEMRFSRPFVLAIVTRVKASTSVRI